MPAHSDTSYWLGPAIIALILINAARAYAVGRRRRPKIRQDEIVYQEHYATGASQRTFVPYHGGHTFSCSPRSIYLQEEEAFDILNHLDQYLALAEAARTSSVRPPPLPGQRSPVLRTWERVCSSSEGAVIELTKEAVLCHQNYLTHRTLTWTYAGVLSGKHDAEIRSNLNETVLQELKREIQTRLTAGPKLEHD
jgi:hypothetical protein